MNAIVTTSDRRELRRLETVVERAARSALDAARALLEIRDRRLYRPDHDTFAGYLQDRWGISRSRGNQLCDWATVAENVSTIVDTPHLLESHARPLARLTPAQQRRAVRQIKALPAPTARAIDAVCRQVRTAPVSGSNGHEVIEPDTGPVPPLNWLGAKHRLAAAIVRLLPPHDAYAEPFFGSGGVFWKKPPSPAELINDLNGDVVNYFRVLRENAAELQRRLKLTPYSRQEYAECQVDHPDPVEKARRFFVRVRQSFASDGKTWGRSLAGKKNRAAEFCQTVDGLHLAAERLRRVQIEQRDAFQLLREIDLDGTTAFLDPPYLPTTRTRFGRTYEHDLTEEQHEELLRIITGWRRGRVVLCGYRSPMYDRALRKWTRYEFVDRCEAARGGNKPTRVETVWVGP